MTRRTIITKAYAIAILRDRFFKIGEIFNNNYRKLFNSSNGHFGNDKTAKVFHDWLKLAFSFKGICCLIPPILAVFFVYYAEANGYYTLILKEYHEPLAIFLMSIAVVLFLIRAFYYRLEIDCILLAMSVNFLCREIHFTGTDTAVVIITVLVLFWILIRKNYIWANIERAQFFQISMTGTAFTYFFSILIARRVFSIDNIAILPNEEYMYDRLEEVIENTAHLYLIFSAVFAFFSIQSKRK
jgi:hypothetical protein